VKFFKVWNLLWNWGFEAERGILRVGFNHCCGFFLFILCVYYNIIIHELINLLFYSRVLSRL
jgi:hypothetical protein